MIDARMEVLPEAWQPVLTKLPTAARNPLRRHLGWQVVADAPPYTGWSRQRWQTAQDHPLPPDPADATDDDLLAVPGIGVGALARFRAIVGPSPQQSCPTCGGAGVVSGRRDRTPAT